MIRANDPSEIQQQMERVRQSLASDRAGIQEAKSNLLNPKKVAARYPLLAIGLAVATGFALAPRLGSKSNPADHESSGNGRTLSNLKNQTAGNPSGRSMVAAFAAMALGTAIRVATGVASRKLAQLLSPIPGSSTDSSTASAQHDTCTAAPNENFDN